MSTDALNVELHAMLRRAERDEDEYALRIRSGRSRGLLPQSGARYPVMMTAEEMRAVLAALTATQSEAP